MNGCTPIRISRRVIRAGMLVVLLVPLGAFAAPFEVKVLPLPAPHAIAFLAHADSDGKADVFFVQGRTLTLYPSTKPDRPVTFQFPDTIALFDVADMEGTEQTGLIGLGNHSAYVWPLPDPNISPPKTLFTFEQTLWEEGSTPRPTVLCVPKEGKNAILIPGETALEWHMMDGTLLGTMPLNKEKDQINTWISSNTGVRLPHPKQESWRAQIAISSPYEPEMLPELKNMMPKESYDNRRFLRTDDGEWWVLPVRKSDNMVKEALICSSTKPSLRTEIKIRMADRKADDQTNYMADRAYAANTSSEHRYAGRFFMPYYNMPDFNGDHFADLVLCSDPLPKTSINAITQTIMAGSLPITISVHLFLPEQNQFDGKTSSQLSFRLPLQEFLFEGGYYGGVIMEDFNNDGRTDYAAKIAGNKYAIWLYREEGFAQEPDYVYPLSGNLESVRYNKKVNRDGRSAILLRTEKTLYVITASEQK